MKLNRISLKDKRLFKQYLSLSRHELAVYSFENIYIWKRLFDIRWQIVDGSLFIFFRDKIGCFLYLPPLAKILMPETIIKAFAIMNRLNINTEISRIENVEIGDLDFYEKLGYRCVQKSSDFLCYQKDLVELRGNAFKSKRSSVNYFLRHYNFAYLPYSGRDKNMCLELYNRWAAQRKSNKPDVLYRGMLEDSLVALKTLLNNYRHLNCKGRIVKINKEIKAFTFGFRLNADTFCILYEIADLSIKGLPQFIFREFCRELKGYKYINIMDDSGLENLRKVKLSYRPVKLIPAHIIKRKDA